MAKSKEDIPWDELPEVMKPEQVQQKIQISRATFFRLVQSGNLPGAKKVGDSWRIDRDQLRVYFQDEEKAEGYGQVMGRDRRQSEENHFDVMGKPEMPEPYDLKQREEEVRAFMRSRLEERSKERPKSRELMIVLEEHYRKTGQTEKLLVLLEETLMDLEKASPDSSDFRLKSLEDLLEETQEKLDELTGEEHSRSTGTEINGNQSASDGK